MTTVSANLFAAGHSAARGCAGYVVDLSFLPNALDIHGGI